MKFAGLLFAVLFSFSTLVYGAEDPSLTVHLLDYLAKDYGGAVQNGKVISKSEYDEQVEFAGIVEKNSKANPKLGANPDFLKGINSLKLMIQQKTSADDVYKLARKLQADAIQIAGIAVEPTQIPDLIHGAKLFQQNCTACHGAQGRGDGAAGASLDPKPANFHDPDLVWNSAPYKYFNTIRLGVPGTGMATYAQLSDKEVWDLSFFLKSLGYSETQIKADLNKLGLTLKDVANLTDAEIAEKLGGKTENNLALIASIRTHSDNNKGNQSPLQIAHQFLNESLEAARKSDYENAERLSLRAYLEGIEPLEPKMKANLPGSVEQIESLMISYRSLLSAKEEISKIEIKKKDIDQKLNELKVLFAENRMSPAVAFGAAFSIFLREGFEALLIIIVLLSVLKAMGQKQAVKWVHIGWASAVVVGIITWFASGILLSMSGLSRELMEGGISILAVLVLLYVGFWLHRYAEAKKWREFLELKLKAGLHAGSYFALAVVSFLAVFREAFEVVLFIRAIWMDLDSSGQNVASLGILSSLAVLLGLSYFAIRESKKLPIGKLFEICSWTMIALAFILAGKGIHSLQEAGIISVSSLPLNVRFDLIGFYPSVETAIAQAFVVIVFGALLFRDKKEEMAAVN